MESWRKGRNESGAFGQSGGGHPLGKVKVSTYVSFHAFLNYTEAKNGKICINIFNIFCGLPEQF